ncbi:hypothetical protein J2S78_000169 [Salibacterium salarium]|uniref:hypothetical protein n=1 Tax=Salibacterium salarium TaxID=284579 RepID=UPI00277EACE3|nr:hypothetical protein [Salibacterium salarium]MDQ0297761.1 hypothetical protein [Salibacterium salarium]
MATWKLYAITVVEIIIFLTIGFILAESVLSRIYENVGIAYMGSVGNVWFGLSFLLFCLYTLFRSFVLPKKNYLLKERITSLTFWIVFVLCIYAVTYPFIKGEI